MDIELNRGQGQQEMVSKVGGTTTARQVNIDEGQDCTIKTTVTTCAHQAQGEFPLELQGTLWFTYDKPVKVKKNVFFPGMFIGAFFFAESQTLFLFFFTLRDNATMA